MKRRSKTISDPNQPSFFDQPVAPILGADFGGQIRELLTETMTAAKINHGIDRYDIAMQMSRLLNRDISKNMLDRYSAPSADEWRFPMEALPALVQVTDDARLLTLVNDACGYKAMPNEAAALAELVTLELQERRIKEQKERLRKQLPKDALDWAVAEAVRRVRP